MTRPATFKAIDADRRHAAGAAFVQANAKIKLLRLGPERIIVRVAEHAVVIRIGSQEPAPHPQFLAGKAHFLDGQGDRLHG